MSPRYNTRLSVRRASAIAVESLEPRRFCDAGLLDSQFNGNGAAVTDFKNVREQARAVLPLADGRVIVVGGYQPSPNVAADWAGFVLVRHNGDGTYDPSFGQGGAVRLHGPAGLNIRVSDAAVQPDGKIVVLGSGSRKATSGPDVPVGLVMARFTDAGAFDTTFATGGVLESNRLDAYDHSGGLTILPDGKILVGGTVRNAAQTTTRLAVLRLNENGATDTTYGTNGLSQTSQHTGNFPSTALLRTGDGGAIVVAQGSGGTASVLLAKFDEDGDAVSGFGSSGVAKFNNAYGEAADAAVALDGGIILAGFSPTGAFRIAKLDSDGDRVNAFGNDGTDDGRIDVPFSGPGAATSVVVQSDGKIVAAGRRRRTGTPSPDQMFALTRLNADGTVDGTWGEFGKTATTLADRTFDEAFDVAIAADGTTYAAGQSHGILANNTLTAGRVGVARFWRAESPSAFMGPRRIRTAGAFGYTFSVVYRDDGEVSAGTFNNPDVEITGPNGAFYRTRFLGSVAQLGGAVRIANYNLAAPGGAFGVEDNGVYTVRLRSNQVGDTEGNLMVGRTLGTIRVMIPGTAVQAASFSGTPIASTLGRAGSADADGDDEDELRLL